LTIIVSNFYNSRLGDQPGKVLTSFIKELTIGCKHDGTYDGILASAALDAQALANARETRS
jgi:hypothetical protein